MNFCVEYKENAPLSVDSFYSHCVKSSNEDALSVQSMQVLMCFVISYLVNICH